MKKGNTAFASVRPSALSLKLKEMKLFDVYPINDINIVKASGSYVWDNSGTEYLDMYGGHAVISIGHTHPHWVKKIEDQLEKIAFYSNSIKIPLQQELADKLGKVSGKNNYQLFLCNSGAEANENALKLASFHNGRKKIIDAQKIFHLMEKRTLAAAYRFYLNKDFENSHTAEADTEATMEVLLAQVARYEGQDVTDGLHNKIGQIQNDVETLSKLTSSGMVDLAGRMILSGKGEEIFNFGKHKNKLVKAVFKEEPAYYEWMMNGDFPLDTKRKLTEIKLRNFKK